MRNPLLWPPKSYWRDRSPALALALGLQLGVAWLFVDALILPETEKKASPHQTQIVFVPTLPPPQIITRKRVKRSASGSGSTAPYFDPYHFDSRRLAAPDTQILAQALSACSIGKYDMASDEAKRLCGRIGALLKPDNGHFGVTQDVADPGHWQRELTRREAPFLMLCMKPHASPNKELIVSVDLATLACVYDLLMHPYDPEKRARYNE